VSARVVPHDHDPAEPSVDSDTGEVLTESGIVTGDADGIQRLDAARSTGVALPQGYHPRIPRPAHHRPFLTATDTGSLNIDVRVAVEAVEVVLPTHVGVTVTGDRHIGALIDGVLLLGPDRDRLGPVLRRQPIRRRRQMSPHQLDLARPALTTSAEEESAVGHRQGPASGVVTEPLLV
jgi:hypothetical protein